MNTGKSVPDPKQLVEGYHERLHAAPPVFQETGIKALDEIIVGLPDSELILIAAKPSQGKTALAVQSAVNLAKRGVPTGIFSLEMSRGQLADRVICAETGIDSQRLRKRRECPLSKDEMDILDQTAEHFAKLPLYVDDRGGLKIQQVYETAKKWSKSLGVRAIFLDYVQLMESESDSREETVGSSARVFKQIAKEINCPFVALSQLNRGMDYRDSRIPRLSDLRDSGQLEQVADTVLMFAFPNSPDDDLDNVRECDIHIKKQRNGPTGVASVMFDKKITSFVPLDHKRLSEARDQRMHSEDEDAPKGKSGGWAGFQPEDEPT